MPLSAQQVVGILLLIVSIATIVIAWRMPDGPRKEKPHSGIRH